MEKVAWVYCVCAFWVRDAFCAVAVCALRPARALDSRVRFRRAPGVSAARFWRVICGSAAFGAFFRPLRSFGSASRIVDMWITCG